MKKILLAIIMAGSFALHSADSLKVVWGMVNWNGMEFTELELENVTYKAWIENYNESYMSNITTEADHGNSIEFYADIRGVCVIDFDNFTDWTWRAGDELHLYVKDYNWSKDESFYEAYADWSIPENAENFYDLGFEDLTGYGGYPISSWIPRAVIADVYIGCVDNNGDKFDFSAYPYDNVSFKCWVTGRENEIIDQNSPGSSFVDWTSDSVLKIIRSDFETGWDNGDTLNVSIKQWIPDQGFYTGEKQFVFTTTHSFSHYGPYDIRFGLGEDAGGNPVMADTWTDDSSIDGILPEINELYQNYPNPFNPVTQIKFALAKTADVKLSVYNISGQMIAELANGSRQAGVHAIEFDGSRLNSGVYYYTLETDGNKITKKMVLTK
ncbi:MAG: T9SS type A sorting domain-containing protein [Candidatus Delongbacteria bacterium]